MQEKSDGGRIDAVSYALALLALWAVLQLNLLAALFSGLLVYSVVHVMAPLLGRKISGERARVVAVATLAILTVSALTIAIWGIVVYFRNFAGNGQGVLQRLADVLDASRNQLPDWLGAYLPSDVTSLKEMATTWLREHAMEARIMGEAAGRTLAHLLIGMIIGAMAALSEAAHLQSPLPLAAALGQRLANLSSAFRRIVFAQVQIAAINTAFTIVYLLVVLPFVGVYLPLRKSLIAITFFAGLLPIVGNLISNSVLVMVGLSHSFEIAMASLAFLVFVHKLEYFLNAKIIGANIQARAWELLVAMLVMEAMFGLPGVIAAPVFYAYLKYELMQRKLV